jgi:hypothetical protein
LPGSGSESVASAHVDPPSVSTALREIGRSLLDQPNFDYLDLTDPMPFVHDAGRTGAQLVLDAIDGRRGDEHV